MKRIKTPYQKFEAIHKLQYHTIIADYKKRISKAKDGFEGKVHFEFLQNVIYPAHLLIQTKLAANSNFLLNIKDCLENDKDKVFEEEFNRRIKVIDTNESESILDDLAELQALNEAIDFIQSEGKQYRLKDTLQTIYENNIQWKGNKVEFLQLIYALHEAGYLNHKKGITALVEEVASLFNIELGKHWPSNLSDNTNNRNTEHQPEIFDKLKAAFSQYREKRIEKNKENRPK